MIVVASTAGMYRTVVESYNRRVLAVGLANWDDMPDTQAVVMGWAPLSLLPCQPSCCTGLQGRWIAVTGSDAGNLWVVPFDGAYVHCLYLLALDTPVPTHVLAEYGCPGMVSAYGLSTLLGCS